MQILKQLLHKFLDKAGYKLVKSDQMDSLEHTLRHFVTKDAPVIIDVGGHIGESIKMFKQWFPKSSIHSFEPSVETFEELKRNTRDLPNTTLVQKALSDKPGIVSLHQNNVAATNSLYSLSESASDNWGDRFSSASVLPDIETLTLTDYCKQTGISSIDILKIDVQGAEHLVLKGASDMFMRSAIHTIVCEIITAPTYEGQVSLRHYFQLAEEYNLELVDIINPYRRNSRLLQVDAIFTAANRQSGPHSNF